MKPESCADNMCILVVDDEASMRLMLATLLKGEGYQVTTASDVASAMAELKEKNFGAVITDLNMPGGSGLDLLTNIIKGGKTMPVIVMSAYGSSDSAITAMRAGAFDYVFKPFQPDEILFSLKKAQATQRLLRENEVLKKAIAVRATDGLIHKSKSMATIMAEVVQIADSHSPVLITGESGTGKDLVARAIHRASGRWSEPFVAVNCGAIPESLLESELFGHVRGAFTGAVKSREGLFRAAHRGTLFLDEIGELPLNFQVMLLRAIQFAEVRPVGGEKSIQIDVRLVAATNQNLGDMVKNRLFREDLYYRLNVLPLHLHPLRQRKEDIPLLAEYFTGKFSARLGRPKPVLDDDFMEALEAYDWPGNIRELENILDRLMIMTTDGQALSASSLPPQYRNLPPENQEEVKPEDLNLNLNPNLNLKSALKKLEAEYIRAALVQGRGNRSEAARILGLSYPSLLSKIKQYGLSLEEASEE